MAVVLNLFALLLLTSAAPPPLITRRVELATYAGAPLASNGTIDCARLRQALEANGANSYNFLLEDKDGRSYLSTVACLDALRNFSVGGVPFSAWLTLIPPTEATSSCSVPADSPLTPPALRPATPSCGPTM